MVKLSDLVKFGKPDKPIVYYECFTDFCTFIKVFEVFGDGKVHKTVTHVLVFDWITYDKAVCNILDFNRRTFEELKKEGVL